MKTNIRIPERAFQKLIYWATKRNTPTHVQFRFLNEEGRQYYRQDAKEQLAQCLEELVIQKRRDRLDYWTTILSTKEQIIIRDLIDPEVFKLSGRHTWGQQAEFHSWYHLSCEGSGAYNIFKEEEIAGFEYKGDTTGVVTINQYNCDVLNTDRMLIVDVDLEGDAWREDDPVVAVSDKQALASLEAFVERNPYLKNSGFRVYKTRAGLRYICTTEEVDPTANATNIIMRSLYCDPRYRNLCRSQETFRARLTPKPWRTSIWPAEYKSEHFMQQPEVGVCELIKIVGSDRIIPQFEKLVDTHDHITHALFEDLYLA